MNSYENQTATCIQISKYKKQVVQTKSIIELIEVKKTEKTKINDIPFDVFQMYIFGHFSTFQLFNMRLVCVEWGDFIKNIWCSRVKDQMLEQIASLDILYQKETTLKILEYKISHLQQYERMLKNFMNRMNLHAISTHLLSTMDSDAIMIVLMSAMLIKPEIVEINFVLSVQGLLVQPTQLTHNNIQDAVQYFTSQSVPDDFVKFSDLKARPSLTINQIKLLRAEYYNKFASNQAIGGLSGNGPVYDNFLQLARVFVTWIDSAIEYTILKHQVRLIRLQYCNVVKAMNSVSSKWPKKKKFIQGAYKLFLFSRESHPLVRQVQKLLNKQGVHQYFDFQKSKEKILQKLKNMQDQKNDAKVQKDQQQSKEELKEEEEENKQQAIEISEQQQLNIATLQKRLKFLKMTQSLKQMVDFVYLKDKKDLLKQEDTHQQNSEKVEEQNSSNKLDQQQQLQKKKTS